MSTGRGIRLTNPYSARSGCCRQHYYLYAANSSCFIPQNFTDLLYYPP